MDHYSGLGSNVGETTSETPRGHPKLHLHGGKFVSFTGDLLSQGRTCRCFLHLDSWKTGDREGKEVGLWRRCAVAWRYAGLWLWGIGNTCTKRIIRGHDWVWVLGPPCSVELHQLVCDGRGGWFADLSCRFFGLWDTDPFTEAYESLLDHQ